MPEIESCLLQDVHVANLHHSVSVHFFSFKVLQMFLQNKNREYALMKDKFAGELILFF